MGSACQADLRSRQAPWGATRLRASLPRRRAGDVSACDPGRSWAPGPCRCPSCCLKPVRAQPTPLGPTTSGHPAPCRSAVAAALATLPLRAGWACAVRAAEPPRCWRTTQLLRAARKRAAPHQGPPGLPSTGSPCLCSSPWPRAGP